jgi:hypothetical protein
VDRAPAPNAKPFLLAWCICFVLMEAFGFACIRSGASTEYDSPSFYTAETLARTHPSHLYNLAEQARLQSLCCPSQPVFLPFYHPPYEPFFLAPFSMLPFRAARLAFIAFNMLLLLAAFFAARSTFSSIIPWWQPRPGLMFFIFIPVLSTMAIGQDSILFLLLCCLAWRQLESNHDVSAGCLLALALFKFHIALPMAVLLVVQRGKRFLAGFAAVSAALLLLSTAIVGPAGMVAFLRDLAGAGSSIGKSQFLQQAMGIFPLTMPNLVGLLYACGARFLPSPMAFNTLCGLCSLGLFAWCAWVIRRADAAAGFSIAVLCGLLLSYHLYLYDLTLALLPVALLANRVPRYVVLGLFGLPILFFAVGTKWSFFLAVPLLAMLAHTLRAASQAAPASSPSLAQARPAAV